MGLPACGAGRDYKDVVPLGLGGCECGLGNKQAVSAGEAGNPEFLFTTQFGRRNREISKPAADPC